MTSPVITRLRDVWGVSGNDVFAVGENGVILHYNGAGLEHHDQPDHPDASGGVGHCRK